jgi:hypothetical protein
MSFTSQFKKLFFFSVFRNSKAVSIGVAVVVLVVGGLWLLYPKYDSIRTKGLLTYDSKKLQLQRRTEYLNKAKSMVEAYQSIDAEKIAMADLILPGDNQIPELFVMLDQLGRDMGFQVSRIAFSEQGTSAKPGQAAPNGQVLRLGITMGLDLGDGISYGKFKEILSTVEQNIRIMDLNSVSYDASQKTMTLNLIAYYLQH